MLKTLLSLAAGGFVAASLSAQCVSPTSFQTTDPFDGTTFFGIPALDAGACAYFDLEVKAGVTINQLGLNFLNGGEGPYNITTTMNPYFTPNLVGTTATVQWWMVNTTGGANGGGVLPNIPQTYSITNGTNPLAPWTLAASSPFTVQGADIPSPTTGFSLALTPGTYGVCLVTVPNGTTLGSTAPTTNRLHPLFRNVGVGSPLLVAEDQTFKFTSRGVRSLAFGASPAGQYMPNIVMNYSLAANSAYSTNFGTGCYDRKKSFYESSDAPPVPGITPAPVALGGLQMIPLGSPVNQYVVTPGAAFPIITPNSAPAWYGAASHVNNYTPGPVYTNPPAVNLFGGWDDSVSTPYVLPFATPFAHPGGSFTQISVCSNGVVYCGANASLPFASGGPRIQMFGLFTELVGGPPVYCAAFGDLWADDGTGGAGQMYVDTDATTATNGTYVAVSWVGVREYPNAATGGTFGNSFQIVFNASGTVNFAWGTVTHSDSAPMTIGYTAGDGLDPGSGPNPRLAVPHPLGGTTSFGTALTAGGGSFLSGNGDKPPVLRAAARPAQGSSFSMNATNLDPTIVLVITWISPISLAPGLDLTVFGMPGCNAYAAYPGIVEGWNFNLGAPTSVAAFGTVPVGVVGDFYAQAVGISIASPQFNAPTFLTQPGLSALVSNGVCLHVDAN